MMWHERAAENLELLVGFKFSKPSENEWKADETFTGCLGHENEQNPNRQQKFPSSVPEPSSVTIRSFKPVWFCCWYFLHIGKCTSRTNRNEEDLCVLSAY